MTRAKLTKRLMLYTFIGFTMVILLLWVDEILDLPHHLFGAAATPINVAESVFETVVVLFLGMLVMTATMNLMSRVKYLEGFLRVCADCKRIKTRDGWQHLETYISEHSEADFSHGFCPDCAEKHYGIVSKRGLWSEEAERATNGRSS
jgi:hypothetical protein